MFVADGEDGKGDLYASPPEGGKAFQITFTRVYERAPALSPDGSILAFLRSRGTGDSSGASLVILNLLNGAERRTDAPAGANAVEWSADGGLLLVRTDSNILSTPAPPLPLALTPVPPSAQPKSDSLFRAILGDPPLGRGPPMFIRRRSLRPSHQWRFAHPLYRRIAPGQLEQRFGGLCRGGSVCGAAIGWGPNPHDSMDWGIQESEGADVLPGGER